MKKSIVILGFISIITIMLVYLYNIKAVKKVKEIIISKSDYIIKKETNLPNSYEYNTKEIKIKKFEDFYKKTGSLLPNDTNPIISELGYGVDMKIFKDIKEENGDLIRDVVIKYPYITGFKNEKLQNKVNKEIEDSALKNYYSYREYFTNIEDDDEEKNFAESIYLESDYTIEYIDENVISVVFRICQYTKGAAVVQNIINSVNINLKTGNKIKINDLLKDSFKDVLRWDKLNLCVYNTIYEKTTTDSYLEPNSEELVDYFDSINKSYDKFYIKENKFIFIFLLIDTDWAFAADYSDLMDSIKWENEVWAGIFKKERG